MFCMIQLGAMDKDIISENNNSRSQHEWIVDISEIGQSTIRKSGQQSKTAWIKETHQKISRAVDTNNVQDLLQVFDTIMMHAFNDLQNNSNQSNTTKYGLMGLTLFCAIAQCGLLAYQITAQHGG
jgi:hypothetical protein